MKRLACLLPIAVLLASCSRKKAAPLLIKNLCKLENDRQELTFEAYLTVPLTVGDCSESCSVNAADTTDFTHGTLLRLRFPVGKGPLTMKAIPPNLTWVDAKAFVVTDSDGRQRHINARVKLTGILHAEMIDIGKNGPVNKVVYCWMTPTAMR